MKAIEKEIVYDRNMNPFHSILSGADRSLVIAESNQFIAVLERRPLVLGHVIVISKRSEDHLFDLNSDELSELMVFSRPIAKAIQAEVPCQKVGVAVIGLETRHAHLHLVPISSADDLNFTRPKLQPDESSLADVAKRIISSAKAP